MLKVRNMVGGTEDDIAELEAQIAAERDKAVEAYAEIERLEQARRAASSYQAAATFEAAVKRHQWVVAHADEVIPELESRLAEARGARQHEAVNRHRNIARQLFPRMKKVLLEAADLQAQLLKTRDAAAAELGERLVEQHIPRLVYMGLIFHDLIAIWANEVSRCIEGPAPQPAALPASAPKPKPADKPMPLINIDLTVKATAEAHPPPPEPAAEPAPPRRPAKRPLLSADPPGEGERQIELLRNGVELELPEGALQSLAGDRVNLASEKARQLVLNGAADYVNATPPAETGGDAA